MLGQHAELRSQHKDAIQTEAPELEPIEQDMAAVYNEIERRTTVRGALRETTRREAPVVAGRIDAGDFGGAADELLSWLEARR